MPRSQTSAWTNRTRSASSAKRIRERILNLLRVHGPQIREVIGKRLRISGDTCRPRLRELMRAGEVYFTGDYRKTAAGNMAEVLGAVRK